MSLSIDGIYSLQFVDLWRTTCSTPMLKHFSLSNLTQPTLSRIFFTRSMKNSFVKKNFKPPFLTLSRNRPSKNHEQ